MEQLIGGANDRGTVFKITPEGVLTTLVEFGRARMKIMVTLPQPLWCRAATVTSMEQLLKVARPTTAQFLDDSYGLVNDACSVYWYRRR